MDVIHHVFKHNRALLKNHTTRIITLCISLSLPACSWASRLDQDRISPVLQGLIDLLTSTPAKLLFIVSIIGVGYGTLYIGKIPKERAIAIIVGIGIIFSASYIAKQMGFTVG